MSTPEVFTNCYITLEISEITQGEMGQMLFSSFTPPSWSTEASKHKYYGGKGTTEVLHGGARVENWGPAELGRGVETQHLLYKWVEQIKEKGPAAAKKDVKITVEAPGAEGSPTPICQWNGIGAIITNFSHAASNASSNEIMTESVTLDAEKWELLDGTGGKIQ